LAEGLYHVGASGQVARQKAYSRDLGRRLRPGGERRGDEHRTRASKERATVYHWMILSARRTNDWGIVSPSVLAVLTLMTSSNLVTRSIGRSPGFAPFKILST